MPWPKSPGYLSGLRDTDEVGTNPKDQYGVAKVPLGLLSVPAQVLQAMCMGVGGEQYGPYNYRKSKVQALIYLEALLRHCKALIDGEDFDKKTGYPHIGFVMATAGIYADCWINGMLIDNRPIQGRGGELIELFNRKPGEPDRTPEENKQLLINFLTTGTGTGAPSADTYPYHNHARADADRPRGTESSPEVRGVKQVRARPSQRKRATRRSKR